VRRRRRLACPRSSSVRLSLSSPSLSSSAARADFASLSFRARRLEGSSSLQRHHRPAWALDVSLSPYLCIPLERLSLLSSSHMYSSQAVVPQSRSQSLYPLLTSCSHRYPRATCTRVYAPRAHSEPRAGSEEAVLEQALLLSRSRSCAQTRTTMGERERGAVRERYRVRRGSMKRGRDKTTTGARRARTPRSKLTASCPCRRRRRPPWPS